MHEFGLAQNLLNTILEQSQERGFSRVHGITMRIGKMSGVVEDAFSFAFESLAEGTLAEGAKLSIEDVPIRCYCTDCGTEFECAEWSYRCPTCNGISTELRSGQEMDLVSMEIS